MLINTSKMLIILLKMAKSLKKKKIYPRGKDMLVPASLNLLQFC